MRNYPRTPRGRARGVAPNIQLLKDAAALFREMTSLLRVYQFRDRDRMGYHGLTITQSYVLEVIIRRGAVTMSDLAEEIRLDKSTLSRVVDGMERKRVVRRVANPADGRSVLIEPTAEGRKRRARIEEDIVLENARILAGFSPAVRRNVVRLIAELTRAARERQLQPVREEGD